MEDKNEFIWHKEYNKNSDGSPEKWYQNCLAINIPLSDDIPFLAIEMPKWLWFVLMIIGIYFVIDYMYL